MKFFTLAFVGLGALLLSACGGGSGVISCDSPEVKKLVGEKMSSLLIGDKSSSVLGRNAASGLSGFLHNAVEYRLDIRSEIYKEGGRTRGCEAKIEGLVSDGALKKVFQETAQGSEAAFIKGEMAMVVVGITRFFVERGEHRFYVATYDVYLDANGRAQLRNFQALKLKSP